MLQLCSKKNWQLKKRGLCLINFFFLARKLKNELVRNYRNCDSREAGNWSGYLFESSQTHSEKSRLDFLTLRGKNWLGSKKKLCLQPKKSPA